MREQDLRKMIITDTAEIFTCVHIGGGIMNMTDRPTYGITLALEGQINYRHRSGVFVSDPSHAVFLPKGMTYTLECAATGRFTVLNFSALNAPDRFLSIPVSDLNELLRVQRELEQLVLTEPFDRLSALSLTYRMLAKLSESSAAPLPPPLRRAISYAVANYQHPETSISSLAKAAGISEVYLRKLFCACRGIPPNRYILSLRMRHAMNLLSGGDAPVGAIALECGYTDASTFSKVFRREIGCTPVEYRRTTRNSMVFALPGEAGDSNPSG